MPLRSVRWLGFTLAFGLSCCARDAMRHGAAVRAGSRRLQPIAPIAGPQTEPNPPSSAASEPVLIVTDHAALEALERWADFGVLVLGLPGPRATNAVLWQSPIYRALVEVIAQELAGLARRDPRAGVGMAGHAHRLFDARWLRAATARFELVAVVNRIDRRSFDPDACGEVRLVYRLAYDQTDGSVRQTSRLPMTWVVELRAGEASSAGGCAELASRWFAAPGLAGRALGEWLVASDGPLPAGALRRERVSQLGLNFQSVRWPSAVRPDLGGHAEYILRAFVWDALAQRYRVRLLENTPDVARLAREPASKRRLLEWLREPARLAQLDTAVGRMPDEFLADSVTSVTPRGLARRANRPFRRLFDARQLGELGFDSLRFARSPEALLRRLDDSTCSGCHQSRSIAGFHLLGDDPADAAPGNALVSGLSPHLQAELPRRERYLRALAGGEAPDDSRPFAEHAAQEPGAYGAHCGLGAAGFASWTCAPGLHCDAYESASDEHSVGSCLPDVIDVGDPCEPARVVPADDPHRDRVERALSRSCVGVCEQTSVGFPGGMCASACENLPPDGACGAIAVLTPFNTCLAQRRPFAECSAAHVRPAGLRACSVERPCRDDYICVRAAGGGTCLPPYFVFQMRVDGHPAPLQ